MTSWILTHMISLMKFLVQRASSPNTHIKERTLWPKLSTTKSAFFVGSWRTQRIIKRKPSTSRKRGEGDATNSYLWAQKQVILILFLTKTKISLTLGLDEELGSIALQNVKEGRDYLWAKTREAFRFTYANYYDEYDWFLKADDDTYVIVENLRYLLQPFNPERGIYFGCKFKQHVKQGYMSGGAGIHKSIFTRKTSLKIIHM